MQKKKGRKSELKEDRRREGKKKIQAQGCCVTQMKPELLVHVWKILLSLMSEH